MVSSVSDHPIDSLQIKQDDKFYTRLLSKESSLANPSFRVYYGVASGSVPFLWESQPGTPKHISSSTTIPPLTPPPSYFSNPRNMSSKKSPKSNSLIHSILPKLKMRKPHTGSPLSSSSLSSSSVSSSSSSSPMASEGNHRRRKSASPRSSFSSRCEDEESDEGSPTSTLCFGMRHRTAGELRGCYSVVLMKNTILSIVGHGSGQGAAA